MMSEKKNNYPPPDSVAIGELKESQQGKYELSKIQLFVLFLCMCSSVEQEKINMPSFTTVFLWAFQPFFLDLFIYADCLLSVGFH